MKTKSKSFRSIFEAMILLSCVIATTMAINSIAALPNMAELWKVHDDPCQAVFIQGGDTTYTTGHIRHCLPESVEQCISHSCQSDFILQ